MKSLIKYTGLSLLLLSFIAFTSCTKDPGFGGKKTIQGTVMMDGEAVNGADVNIAFDATEATDTYDYTTVTDASGNYFFEGITPGSYYISAYYMDDNGFEYSAPGYIITVEDKKADLTVDLTLN